jgi:hypothetical protein
LDIFVLSEYCRNILNAEKFSDIGHLCYEELNIENGEEKRKGGLGCGISIYQLSGRRPLQPHNSKLPAEKRGNPVGVAAFPPPYSKSMHLNAVLTTVLGLWWAKRTNNFVPA